MNTKAILASLLLGSSSIAMAAPAAPGVTLATEGRGDFGTTVVRDHRDADSYTSSLAQPGIHPIYDRDGQRGWNGRGPLPPVYRPVTLASELRLPGNGQTIINAGAQLGRFGTLQITATSGRVFVRQVYVQFADGERQIVRNLDRTLTGGERLTLDLDGGRRAIRRIVVSGSSSNRTWRRSAGTFSVTAS